MEQILCSAIHVNDGEEHVHQPVNIENGFVVCGRRHHNCFHIISMILGNERQKGNETQGFLTSEDRFVDRREAAKIAHEAGQTEKFKGKLFSEDLY